MHANVTLRRIRGLRVLLPCMFALHAFSVSALLVSTDFGCTGQLLVRAPPSASLRRGGSTACAQAVVLARLLGLMHVCLHACVVTYFCFLPIRIRKMSLAAALRCATGTCSCQCVLLCLASSRVSVRAPAQTCAC